MIAKHHAKLLKDCYGDGLNASAFYEIIQRLMHRPEKNKEV